MLQFRILGPLEVERDGAPIRLTAPKQRATLAILLLSANRVIPVEGLADALYAGAPPVTAVTQVQRQISELRKALGSDAPIETRPPGYLLRVGSEQLDLQRFERLAGDAALCRSRGDVAAAADLFREALAIWRGAPLADLGYESFARPVIERLDEIRLEALEQRLDADLALGRHAAVVGELEELIAEHPLRERFCALLMLALYRSGRQADALAAYRRARAALVDELGLEPTAALRDLEQAILRQDPSLELDATAAATSRPDPARVVLLVASQEDALDHLLALAEPLARRPSRELIVAFLTPDEDEIGNAADSLNARRAALSVPARVAAFATRELGGDILRLTATHEVDLVLVAAPPGLSAARVPNDLETLFARSTPDVAVVRGATNRNGGGIFVPFGGSEHDWAAAELGAWLAQTSGSRLTLVGTKADPERGRRDASRLLADASLAVQQLAGVETVPLLAEPTEQGLVDAVAVADLVVAGISEQWRRQGIGDVRRALLREVPQAVVLVHRGLRPGGLAPGGSETRFTWSAASRGYLQAVSSAPT